MANKVNLRFTKAKFIMKINEVERYIEEDKIKLKIVNSDLKPCRGSDFERSLKEDYNNKVERKIEFCDKEPEIFSLGVFYVRKDGKFVYVFNEVKN